MKLKSHYLAAIIVGSISSAAQASFSPVILNKFESIYQDSTSYWKEIDIDMISVCSWNSLSDLRSEQGMIQDNQSEIFRLKTYRSGRVTSLLTSATFYNSHKLPTNGEDYAYVGGLEPVSFYQPNILCRTSGFSTQQIGGFEKDIRENGILLRIEPPASESSVVFESFATFVDATGGPRVRFSAIYDAHESNVVVSISHLDQNNPERWVKLYEATNKHVSSQVVKNLPAGEPSDYNGGWAYDYPRTEEVRLDRKTLSHSLRLPYPTLVRVSIRVESEDNKPHVHLLEAKLQTEECVIDAGSAEGNCL